MLQFLLIGLAAGLVFTLVEMWITFRVAQNIKNAGIVDVVWSGGFAVLMALYCLLPSALVSAWSWPPLPTLVLAAMVIFWSVRLALHLGARVAAHHPEEDVRYARLRKEWGEDAGEKLFWFFQLQGVLQVALSLPFLLVVLAQPQHLSAWQLTGLALWIVGILGETVADLQLAAFRSQPQNRGKVCQVGLWNYSRHPNYFFEWLIWAAYAIYALSVPWGWLGLIAPLLMGHFLINVTGIPFTEELSVQSKGEAYREYQRTTSAFVPWFKRKGIGS